MSQTYFYLYFFSSLNLKTVNKNDSNKREKPYKAEELGSKKISSNTTWESPALPSSTLLLIFLNQI